MTIIGAAFAIVILNHYFATRRRPHELMWGIAFVLFAVGSAAQVLADVGGGWTPVLARTYYLTGAILNVAFLGLGTIYLLFSRRVANASLAVTLVLTVISVYVLYAVPVNASALGESQRVDWKAVFETSRAPSILAFIGSGVGSILVVGGALWSGMTFLRKRIMKSRMIGVFLIAIGTFTIATGGTLKAAFNNDHFLYPTMALGVIIMFVGYLQTIRPAPSPQATATHPAPERSSTV